MKTFEKYSLTILRADGSLIGSWTISKRAVQWLKLLSVMLILGIGFVVAYYGPRAWRYSRLEAENRILLEERAQVAQIARDFERIKEINAFLRKTLEPQLGFAPTDSLQAPVYPYRQESLLENVPTLPPLQGFINAPFNATPGLFNPGHLGIDLSSIGDRTIKAAGSGYVLFSGWTYPLGNLVIIDHENGYITFYGHNERNFVKPRDRVKRGDPIALVGNTGHSAGPHLHFEIWYHGRPVNPVELLPELAAPDSTSAKGG